MAVEPSGRLELTWTNKHLRLLADQEGGYQWVPPSDYRVAEVRLLHDVEEVGETRGERSRAKDNLLIAGATKDVETADVKGKETAARRWARYVSDDPAVGVGWDYLLLSEDDIEAARGSWAALRKLEAGS